ncbi:S-layer homology domain-containing protein [Cronbergia sp. UHCC 0137]|uniref:S-layer homology domain-containing protein n=1 Tax=Cronbergia sp. UHCC 0137 TaxID=3110239 RepID=UPI002B1FB653|nr:S-layer homology domain-containing protein [Cronbergia sp. UHCC 0137]MEA5620909.1 S-layer homology domain-containing protein [Cronbergia sp. UHCC 0137]
MVKKDSISCTLKQLSTRFSLSNKKGTITIRDIKSIHNSSTSNSNFQNHWATVYIQALAARGIFNGFPTPSLNPDAQITRAQFAFIIAKAFNPPAKRQSAIAETKKRISKGRKIKININTFNVAEQYSDYPKQHPVGYTFIFSGAATEQVMISPQFLSIISKQQTKSEATLQGIKGSLLINFALIFSLL